MCEPILVTLLKMRPHYFQSSRKNATSSSGTSPLASYKEVPPPPGFFVKVSSSLTIYLNGSREFGSRNKIRKLNFSEYIFNNSNCCKLFIDKYLQYCNCLLFVVFYRRFRFCCKYSFLAFSFNCIV